MWRIASAIGLAVMLIGTLNLPLNAQEIVGDIVGSVQDASGGIVVGASMVAHNEATGVDRKTVSTSTGNYAFPSLPIGTYTVTAAFSGFETVIEKGARVVSGQTLTVDFKLPIGTTSQALTVTAAPPVINTELNVTGTTLTTEEVDTLPMVMTADSRNAIGVIRTMSGINWNFSNLEYQTVSRGNIQGAPTGEAGFMVDGLPNGVSGNELGEDFFNALPEAVAELRVSTNDTAEFGATSGATVSITTKSGTNQLHGSLFDYIHNDDLDARNFFSSTVPINKQNEFGVAIGGPVVIPKIYNGKDRTFFFAYYDGWRYHFTGTSARETVPTPLMRSGDFSQLLGPAIGTDVLGRPIYSGEIYDPSSTRSDGHGGFIRDPFDYGGVLNKINPALLSPVSQAFQSQMSTPNLPGTSLNDVGVTTALPDYSDRISIKIDHMISANHRLSFTLEDSWRDMEEIAGNTYAPTINGAFENIFPEYHLRLKYNWSISPTLLLEIAAGFNRDNRVHGTVPFPSADYGATAGLKGVLTPDTPSVGIEGYTGFGFVFLYLKLHDQSTPAAVNLTWSKGKHNLRFGTTFISMRDTNIYDITTNGSFSFSHLETAFPNLTSTGSGYASFLLGQADSGTVSSPWDNSGFGGNIGLYAMDQWRLTPKLTVNSGLRYDIFLPIVEGLDKVGAFSPTVPNAGAGGLLGALTFWGNGPGRNGRHLVLDRYWKAFGPQIGLAYKLTPKMVVRAHYGLSYEAAYSNFTGGYNVPQAGWNDNLTSASTNSGLTPAFNWTTGFPLSFPVLPLLDPTLENGSSIGYINPKDNKPGMSQNINVGIERELPGDIGIRVDYVGALSHGLPTNGLVQLDDLDPTYLSLGNTLNANINSAAAAAAGIKAPFPGFNQSVAQALRPYPQYLGVPDLGGANGYSEYNSMQVNVQKRFGRGFSFLAAYTVSKMLDNTYFGQQGWGASPGLQANTQLRIGKQIDNLDRPQALNLSYIYDLPFGPGKRFGNTSSPILKQVVGGWQFAGIHNYFSGWPVQIGDTASLPGGLRAWPIRNLGVPTELRSCGNVDPGNPATNSYLNVNAFSTPAAFTFGNTLVQPSTRGCGYFSENMSLIKSFTFQESRKFMIGVNAFNIFNRHQFTGVGTNIGVPGFGQFTGASAARSVQLYGKFTF